MGSRPMVHPARGLTPTSFSPFACATFRLHRRRSARRFSGARHALSLRRRVGPMDSAGAGCPPQEAPMMRPVRLRTVVTALLVVTASSVTGVGIGRLAVKAVLGAD